MARPDKKLPFNKMSLKQCATKGCTSYLKARLVQEKPTAKHCYKCYAKQEAKKENAAQHWRRKANDVKETSES